MKAFESFFRLAVARAVAEAEAESGGGDLGHFRSLCSRGVGRNWSDLTAQEFLSTYHRVIAVSGRRADVVDARLAEQTALFRGCDAARLVHEREVVLKDWKPRNLSLRLNMVTAVLDTGALIDSGWESFREQYLILPRNPDSESLRDWRPSLRALQELPMVAKKNALYLVRNLYGAPFLKPDCHIVGIANEFFGDGANPLDELARAIREVWHRVYEDEQFPTAHMGLADYLLWNHRRRSGAVHSSLAARCS